MKNVLIAARTADACRTLGGYIDRAAYDVTTATDGNTVREIDIDRYDVVFVSVPLENESGLELIAELRRRSDAPHIIAIVREEAADAAYKKLSPTGAYIITKPLFKGSLMQAIRFCEMHAENEKALRKRVSELEQLPELEKKLARAKIMLVEKGMTEEQAHRKLQKLAMDLRTSVYDVAEDIINGLLL